MPAKVAIAGSRGFHHREKVREYVRGLPPGTTVISGKCKGSPDEVAEEEAIACGLPFLPFPAEWEKYPGKSAAHYRNVEIVKNSDRVVCFWDGSSKGTKDVIDITELFRKPLKIISDCGIDDPPF